MTNHSLTNLLKHHDYEIYTQLHMYKDNQPNDTTRTKDRIHDHKWSCHSSANRFLDTKDQVYGYLISYHTSANRLLS